MFRKLRGTPLLSLPNTLRNELSNLSADAVLTPRLSMNRVAAITSSSFFLIKEIAPLEAQLVCSLGFGAQALVAGLVRPQALAFVNRFPYFGEIRTILVECG